MSLSSRQSRRGDKVVPCIGLSQVVPCISLSQLYHVSVYLRLYHVSVYLGLYHVSVYLSCTMYQFISGCTMYQFISAGHELDVVGTIGDSSRYETRQRERTQTVCVELFQPLGTPGRLPQTCLAGRADGLGQEENGRA
ncbi:hypothetical protein RRG08_029233 [Elysia crispata]|uniref:Uncharacterized protein n=1 Tax=Elysia crispata TaxID=231223 RepID=A0AAE1AJT7_9GAST|nr:hypothetical protein RRG08_029233 [Elysia crispata]